MDPAIIAPGLSCPCKTSHAPAPSIADCKNILKAFEIDPNRPARSPASKPSASAALRTLCQRLKAAPVMPRARTVSASVFIRSDRRSDCRVSPLVRLNGSWVSFWFRTVRAIRTSPPDIASHPSRGWNTKMAAMNSGVQGMSKIAIRTGEAQRRCRASRSR